MATPPAHHRRPEWARRLDRWLEPALGVLRRMLPRPSDGALTALARQDRPAPPIRVPTPAELGILDHLEEGRRAFAGGRYGEALHHFGQLLETSPEHPWAWHGRGDALQLMGEHEEALAAYHRAAAIQSREPLHLLGLANAYASLNQVEDAVEARQRAARLRPSGRD